MDPSDQKCRSEAREIAARIFWAVSSGRNPDLLDMVRGTRFCVAYWSRPEMGDGGETEALCLRLETLLDAAGLQWKEKCERSIAIGNR